jgi:Domain of unknown function (DUF4126)
MDFVFDLLQGIGIAAAIGIRPFLPIVLVAGLAQADLGLDFDGTDFAFLESWPVIIGFFVGAAVSFVTDDPLGSVRVKVALLAAIGALFAAGSLADHGYTIVPGIVGGAAAAVLGFLASQSLFTRVRRRLDPDAARALPLYGEGAALLAAGLSILFPPVAVVVVAGLAWLLAGGRRREGEKYAGLRVLK